MIGRESIPQSSAKVEPNASGHYDTSTPRHNRNVGRHADLCANHKGHPKEVATNSESRAGLEHVDECLKVYTATIDKKVSDQAQREVDQIEMCKSSELYPPRTKAN